MKKYRTPKVDIVYLDIADIMTTSVILYKTEGIGYSERDCVINIDEL